MQVVEGEHAARVDPRDAAARHEHESIRHGTQALFAAFDMQTGRVFGEVGATRSAAALVAFMEKLGA